MRLLSRWKAVLCAFAPSGGVFLGIMHVPSKAITVFADPSLQMYVPEGLLGALDDQQIQPGSFKYIETEMFAPVASGFPRGLDVLEIYADLPGSHPLVLLTHGTSSDDIQKRHVTPWAQFGQAMWFARRGYVAIIVVRAGYGRSGGERDGRINGCSARSSFVDLGDESAGELKEIIKWAFKRPEIDAAHIVSVGVSSGGFAQVALASDPPIGLRAIISFAGGRGGDGKEHTCDPDKIVDAFHTFGRRAAKHRHVPMLWIYSQNDHWFPPAMSSRFKEAYQKSRWICKLHHGSSRRARWSPPFRPCGSLVRNIKRLSIRTKAFTLRRFYSSRPGSRRVTATSKSAATGSKCVAGVSCDATV